MGLFNKIGNAVSNVVNQASNAASAISSYSERLIKQREADQARKVFRETIPYGRVFVSNGLGFQQRAYTIPHPLMPGFYIIHIGQDGYTNAVSSNSEKTFIHELTHVWQGHNNIFPFGYVFNSIWHQATQGNGAYNYTPGSAWSSYNVEQQAQIVMHWWQQGGSESNNDPRWRYIRDNIRGLQR